MTCRHHYLIPRPDQGEPIGVCKHCGETRLFSNEPVYTFRGYPALLDNEDAPVRPEPPDQALGDPPLPAPAAPLAAPAPGADDVAPLRRRCAWCAGDRDPDATDGICARHAAELMTDYARYRRRMLDAYAAREEAADAGH